MSLGLVAILDSVVTHLLTLGVFDRVNAHEPRDAPGQGVSAAVWVAEVNPVAAASGLSATTARVVLDCRISMDALAEPQDGIDPMLVNALDLTMAALSGDLTLSGNVRCVDLLGQGGAALAAVAGYMTAGATTYRVYTLTIPLIVNDVWLQGV